MFYVWKSNQIRSLSWKSRFLICQVIQLWLSLSTTTQFFLPLWAAIENRTKNSAADKGHWPSASLPARLPACLPVQFVFLERVVQKSETKTWVDYAYYNFVSIGCCLCRIFNAFLCRREVGVSYQVFIRTKLFYIVNSLLAYNGNQTTSLSFCLKH